MYRHISKVNHLFIKRNMTLFSSYFALITNFEECSLHRLDRIRD